MRLKFTFLVGVLAFVAVPFFSSAQSTTTHQLTMTKVRQRMPFQAMPGRNVVDLSGVSPGQVHTFTAISADNKYNLHLFNPEEEAAALLISPVERPHLRRFTPPGKSVKLYFDNPGPETVVTLSASCDECPTDWDLLEKVGFTPDAAITTSGGTSANNLITNVLIGGNCFDVSGITATGDNLSRGTFANGATNIGIPNGVVLCTGNVGIIPGNNTSGNANGGFGVNSPNDTDLATLTTGDQFDVTKIEFNFRPTSDMVQFDFVFASEEYCEFVGTGFNDAFGFFISGPGITGTQNIALIPATTTPVTINNVNHASNTAYYVNNNTFNGCNGLPAFAPTEITMDGFTSVLTATAEVIPCSTYHIKLALADIGDASYASAVFLRANSFNAGGQVNAAPIYPTSGSQFVYEAGCGGTGYIRFTRVSNDLSEPLEVNFTIAPSSTATPDEDYTSLTSPVIIPAGQSFVQIPINVLPDLILEGNETITLLLDNPCSCTQQPVTFTIVDVPPLLAELEDQTLCGTSVTLSPTISSGVAPYTYLWSNNATTASITITTPGINTYTATITDACNNTTTVTSTVDLTPGPTATISGSGLLCEGTNGSFNLTVNFTGLGPWDLEWSGGTDVFTTSPATLTVTDPGTYTLVSVNANGCPGSVSGSANITEVDVNISLNATDPACNGSTNGSITSSVSGGTGPYTYAWTPAGAGANPNNLPAGTYSVTVTSSQGCTETDEITLDQPDPLEVTASADPIDCNNPSSQIETNVSGGTPNYTYNWSNGSSSAMPNINVGGTFVLTVTDSKGCTKTTSLTVPANTTLPNAVATVNGQINCNQSTIALNGNGSSTGSNFTYEWNGPGIVSDETTLTPVVDAPGTYVLTVTNTDNGCTRTVSVSVTANITPPNAVIAPPQNIGCNSPTVNLNANGTSQGANFTFVWSTLDGNFTGGTATLNPTINQDGTYTILVTNTANGCTNEASVTVNGNTTPPVAVIEPPITVTCNDPAIQIDASNSSTGSFTYNWSGPPGGINSGGNTLTPTVDVGGTYTITITDTQNNCTTTASVTVNQDTNLPTAVATPTGPITCTTTEISINGNGSSTGSNFTYEWNGPGLVSGENTLNPIVDAPGTYVLTVTNTDNGCTRTVSVSVTANVALPNAVIANPQNIGCNSPTISLNGNGSSQGSNFTFVWSTLDGNFTGGTNTLNPSANQEGTYTLVVTNNTNGCTDEATVTVSGNTIPPVAMIEPPQTITCDDPTIQIDASNSSSGGFTYSWSGPAGGINSGGSTLTPTVDVGGTYTITITDQQNNCTTTATVNVPQNTTQPVAVANVSGVISCQTPTLTINGNGSSTGSNFTYEWSTNNGSIVSGENTLNPEVSQGGTYILTVTDTNNGCTRTVSVNVPSNNSIPQVNAGPPRTINCYNPTITINASGSTGASFTYAWTASPGNIVSGGNTLSPVINQAGCYTLVVTNTTNQCTAEDVMCVDENFDTPEAIIAPPVQLDCNNPTIELDATASTQPPGITYSWTGPSGGINSGGNSDSPTVDMPGTYNLTITNSVSGCTDTEQVTVTRDITPPVAEAGTGGQLDCTEPTLYLNGMGSSVGGVFSYEWVTINGNIVSGENTLQPLIDEAGTYTIIVTNNSNGCTKTDQVVVTANQNIPNANAGPEKQLNCNNLTVTLNGTATPSGLTFQWSTFDGNIVSGATTLNPTVNQEGTYYLTITNPINGCTDTDEVFVTNNLSYPTAFIADPQILDCNNPSIELDATQSDPGFNGASMNFQWTGAPSSGISGTSSQTPTITAPGTYTLLIRNQTSQCTATAVVTVQQNITPPTVVINQSPTLTCQFPQVTLNANGSSVNYPFFAEWSTTNGNIVSGENTLNPIVNQIGTYLLTITNSENGCTSTGNATVTTNQTFPTALAGPPQTINCTNPQVALNAAGSSTGTQFSYIWSTQNGTIVTGVNTLTPTVSAPGAYQIAVVNTTTGCVSTATVNVNLDVAAPTAVTAPGGILSCAVNTLTLSGAGSSTGTNYSYVWNTPTGNILSGINTLSPVINAVGTYQLVVTNAQNGCTSTSSTSVLADASLPVASAGQPDTITCFAPTLTLSGNGSSQGNGIVYQWSGAGLVQGINTLQPTINQPGQYTLLVTNNNNGCTALASVEIANNTTAPTAEAGAPSVINCTFPTRVLDGTNSSTGAQYLYNWATNTGTFVNGQNTLNPEVSAPGLYSLLVTNTQNGCTSTDAVNISQNTVAPTAEAGPAGFINCTSPTISLNGSSNNAPQLVYNWTTTNGNIAAGVNTLTPTIDAPGQYTLLVTDTINGCTASDVANVTKDANVPIAAVATPEILDCNTASVQLNANASTAGLQYTWSTANGQIQSGVNSLTPTIGLPGQYTLQVFNPTNNCTAQSTVSVLIDTISPVAQAGNPQVLSCQNPILTLNGTGSSSGSGFAYLWSTQGGNIVSGATTLSPQVNESGFYTITVTNQNTGCTNAATVQILLDQNTPEADAGPAQLLTCTVDELQLIGTASSQGPQFTYQWTGPGIVSGGNTLTPVINVQGTYNLFISNTSNGCTSDASVLVTQDIAAPVASIAPPPMLNCQLTNTTLTATNTSSAANFSYAWSSTNGGSFVAGANTSTPKIDNPGTYQLLVTNTITGCTSTLTVDVAEDIATPIPDAGTGGQLNCTTPTYQLGGTATNTGPNFSILWTTTNGNIVSGENTFAPIINEPGTYTLLITNNNNFCTATDNVTMQQNVNAPLAVAATPQTLTCAVQSINLNGFGSSNGSDFSYLWTTQTGTITSGDSTLTPTVSAPGDYQLQVTNTSNNCVSLVTVQVPQNIVPPAAIGGPAVTLTCSLADINLNGAGSSSGAGFSYVWSVPTGSNGNILFGANSLTPTVNAPGLYQLVVTNTQNGCKSTATAEVLQDVNAPNAAIGTPGELTCLVTTVQLDGTGTSTGSDISYAWSTLNGNIISGQYSLTPVVDAPGSYALEVTNTANGCKTLANIAVTENILAPQTLAGPDQTLTCAVTSLTINATATGGSNGINIVWNGPGILSGGNTISPVINQPGTYTLMVSDIYNGCTDSDAVLVFPDTNAPVAAVATPGLLTCAVQNVPLVGNGSSQGPEFNYLWQGPGITGSTTNLSTTVSEPGTYALLITNTANGCTTTTSVTVPQDIQLPLAEAGNGFELTCATQEDALSAVGSSAGANFKYLWSTTDGNIVLGGTTATPLVNEAGLYTLLVTNTATGCTSTDNVLVIRNTNYPADLLTETVKPACNNQPGTIVITEVTGGVGPYLYSIDGGNKFYSANTFPQLNPGTYTLVVQDANGCEYEESLTFPVPVEPDVTTNPQITLDFGQSTTLVANINVPISEIDTIIWSPMTGLTPTAKPTEMLAQPFYTTTYEVLIINKDGCEDRASVQIKVEDPRIYAPNVITPDNGTDDNDRFTIFAKEGHVKNIRYLQVYDRWGNKVFFTSNVQPNDRTKGWDGVFRDASMTPAVFVWWAEVELASGEIILLEGDVTVVR